MIGTVHCFGVRHHGPGSARSLVDALAALQPDIVLVEGPPDAEALISFAADPTMRPPVALLVHARDEPGRAVFYPFAAFSPEWQALRFAAAQGIPARFIDLPQATRMALATEAAAAAEADEASDTDVEVTGESDGEPTSLPRPIDPLHTIAELAGYADGERWWEAHFEERGGTEVFAAIAELMTALRGEAEREHPPTRLEQLREAHMRRAIRAAARKHKRVAVVVGAWHVPAIAGLTIGAPADGAAEDDALLRGLPSLPTASTWIPWTDDRLARASGYGAGIRSAAYYQHLWSTPPAERTVRWIAGAARLIRDADLTAAPAGVIDAVRLAEMLAAVRGQPTVGLAEMLEAVRGVLCFGAEAPLALIRRKLIVGDGIGTVPETVPTVPLQADLRLAQRRLRLQPKATATPLTLDLRKPNDLERSQLLHRLLLLGIPWSKRGKATGQGTYREVWSLLWTPELDVRVMERARFGNTVAEAATAYVGETVNAASGIAPIALLIDDLLRAHLPEALASSLARLSALAATTHDVDQLMAALPALAAGLRFGDVRRTDAQALEAVVRTLVIRIAVGLEPACAGLGDDEALVMVAAIDRTDAAIATLADTVLTEAWTAALTKIADREDLHGRIAGRAVRRLADAGAIDGAAILTRLGRAVSRTGDAERAARWIEGFLHGSGALLLHDDTLWAVIDDWLAGLREEDFRTLLPLLRRTFASFPAGERRQLGRRSASTAMPVATGADAEEDLDAARAALVMPVLALILGEPR